MRLLVAGLALYALSLGVTPPAAAAGAEDRTVSVESQTVDGRAVTVTKAVVGGKDVTVVDGADAVGTDPQAAALDALRRRAAAAPDATLSLILWLKSRPGSRIARELREQVRPQLDALALQARTLHQAIQPRESLSPQQERVFLSRFALAGGTEPFHTPEQRAALTRLGRTAEARGQALRREITRRVREAVAPEQNRVAARVASLGGQTRGRIESQNVLHVTLPAGRLEELLQEPLVARVTESAPVAFELDVSRQAVGAEAFWNAGFTGSVWDAGLVDSGVEGSHPAFQGIEFLRFGGVTGDFFGGIGHGTPAAGIIASRDGTRRGMAPGMQTLLVSQLPTDSTADAQAMVQADWMVRGTIDDAEVINLSGGFGPANDNDYSPFDQFWDGLTDDHSVLVTKSAGNAGSAPTTMTHPANAFNAITVAEMDDKGTGPRGDDRIFNTSSRGPTLGGRKKPDLTAPGTKIGTTAKNWAGNNPDFGNFSGTSAAAPHVAGGAILLTDMRAIDWPYVTKAVLINTADTWTDSGMTLGSGWNSTYGWGYMNLAAAALHAQDVFEASVDDGITPPGPDFKLFLGPMFLFEKATLVWNRHLTHNGGSFPIGVEPLTDLDLHMFHAQTGASLASSTTGMENVEQVSLGLQTESAVVVLKVDVFGSIGPSVGVERFGLATQENFVAATPPTFALSSEVTRGVGSFRTLRVSVRNDGTVNAFNNQLTVTGFFSGTVSYPMLAPGETRSFFFNGNCLGGGAFQQYRYTNTSTSYDEQFSGTGTSFLSCS